MSTKQGTSTSVSLEKLGIPQFEGKNFDSWIFRPETLLDYHEVRECIQRKPADTEVEFAKKDKKAKAIIIQCMSDQYLEYVKDKTTAYDMWQSLVNGFQRKGIASQLYLRKKLLLPRPKENKPLEEYFIRFEEIISDLKNIGVKLENLDIVCHLLVSLPKNYEGIVTALDTVDVDKLSLEYVKDRLLDFEVKQKLNQETKPKKFADSYAFVNKIENFRYNNLSSSNSSQSNNWRSKQVNRNDQNSRFSDDKNTLDFKCYSCRKPGHKSYKCRSKKIQSNYSEKVSFLTERIAKSEVNQSETRPKRRNRILH